MVSVPVWVFYNLEYYKSGGKKPATAEPEQKEQLDMEVETERTQEEQDVVARGEAQNYWVWALALCIYSVMCSWIQGRIF